MAKTNLQTARKSSKTSFKLDSKHVTTFDVGQLRPTNIYPCIQGDTFKVRMNLFSRLSPLSVPSFGSFEFRTHAFFVPMHTIFEKYQDWRSNSVDASIGTAINVSYYSFCLNDLFNYLFNTPDPVTATGTNTSLLRIDSNGTGEPPTSVASDIITVKFESNNASWRSFNLTKKGKNLFNILRSLGYEIPSYIQYYGSFYDTENVEMQNYLNERKYSYFPLLAFARVCYDYYYPARFVQQGGFASLFDDIWNEFQETQSTRADIFNRIMNLVFCQYDDSFFKNLWMSFNSPNGQTPPYTGLNTLGDDNVYNPLSNTLSGGVRSQGNFITQFSDTTRSTLSSYALRWLQSVSDYVLRSNVAGTRFFEWAKAHFGFVTKEEDYSRSVFIRSHKSNVQISDVTNFAFADNSVLGEQGGKGIATGKDMTFTYDCKEDGYLIFVTALLPTTAFYQGDKPWTKALRTSTDIYTPEFDSLGNEAIPRSAVFSSYQSKSDYNKVPYATANNVFGFAPKYAFKYKTGFDFLTGDFRFGSRNTLLPAYHTFRDVLYGRSDLSLNAQFMQVDNQYDRIFAVAPTSQDANSGLFDRFFTFIGFDVTKSSYMLSLGESLPLFNKQGDGTEISYLGEDM